MRLRTIALNDLRRRRGRTVFLVAGLLIGVATVVALLTITQSMTREARGELESFGANIVVAPRSEDVSVSYGGARIGGVAVGAHSLTMADLVAIESGAARSSLDAVAPQLVSPVRVNGRRALLLGVRPADQFRLKRWWSVDPGRRPANGHELVAGASAARTLGLEMGDYVRLRGKRFTVTGILRPTGSQDDELLVADLAAVQRLLRTPDELTLIEVAATYSGAPVDAVVEQLQDALPDARVTSLQEAVRGRLHAVDRFRAFSYGIVAVVVGIELLVVFLTMMGAVSARTHEIGVFRAIGFRRVHITRLILVEAAVASFAAGILGYVVGMGLTYAVLPAVAGGAEVVWTPLVAVAAVTLAVLVGGVASVYPALRAGRMDPSDALRAV